MHQLELQTLARHRLEEAKVLLDALPPWPSGAYYLAGYAVECALKAIICNRFQALEWPEKKFVLECHTHDLRSLFRLANLEDDRDNEINRNASFRDNWLIVQKWNEQSRYQQFDMIQAVILLDAIADPHHGVLPWIMSH